MGGARMLFRDVLLIFAFVLAATVIILLPFINPQADENSRPPGNVTVELNWPSGWNVDVDVWILGPIGSPVGYSHKHGILFDLLRDDVGTVNDSGPANYEFAYSRGIVDGKYIVTIHLYSHWAGEWPVPVDVIIKYRSKNQGKAVQIMKDTFPLIWYGQEITVARWEMLDGSLVVDSLNDRPVSIRTSLTQPRTQGRGM